jgi:hypothetical protein
MQSQSLSAVSDITLTQEADSFVGEVLAFSSIDDHDHETQSTALSTFTKLTGGRQLSGIWSSLTSIESPNKQPTVECQHCHAKVKTDTKVRLAKKHLLNCRAFHLSLPIVPSTEQPDYPDWYKTEIASHSKKRKTEGELRQMKLTGKQGLVVPRMTIVEQSTFERRLAKYLPIRRPVGVR